MLGGDLLFKLDYIPSEDNPGDAPSRGDCPPVAKATHSCPSRTVGMLLSLHKDFLMTFVMFFICLFRDTFCIVFLLFSLSRVILYR